MKVLKTIVLIIVAIPAIIFLGIFLAFVRFIIDSYCDDDDEGHPSMDPDEYDALL